MNDYVYDGYNAMGFARQQQAAQASLAHQHMWQALSERFPGQVPYTNSFVDRSGTRWSVGYDERGLKCWVPEYEDGPW